jgi:hypothetical protein
LAGLYVFGPPARLAGIQAISLDGDKVGEVAGSSYLYLPVAPGTHTISIEGFHASFTAEAGKNYCFVRNVLGVSAITDDKARTYAKKYTLSVDSGSGQRAVLKVATTVQLEATVGDLHLLGINPHRRMICSFRLSSADGRPFRASPGHPAGLKPGQHSITFTYHVDPPSGYQFTGHHPDDIVRTLDVKLEAGKTYIAAYDLQSKSVTITEEASVP